MTKVKDLKKVDEIIAHHKMKMSSLIGMLEDVQKQYNYLPKEAIKKIAYELGITAISVYSVATFYKVFSLKPRGKYIINVCVGTACHVRGGRRIVENLQKGLEVEVGETTDDMQFTLETVRCLGACALGPVMEINGEYYGQLTTKKADKVLNDYKMKGGNT